MPGVGANLRLGVKLPVCVTCVSPKGRRKSDKRNALVEKDTQREMQRVQQVISRRASPQHLTYQATRLELDPKEHRRVVVFNFHPTSGGIDPRRYGGACRCSALRAPQPLVNLRL
jgi:hypothetical protein